ncbi:MAG: Grx4 family monothiol glutaredoxin [Gammaproteobacteria bacterium]
MNGEFAQYPDSPCIGTCRIGADGCCEGCLRTLDEIACWGEMTDAERVQVYATLAKRNLRQGPLGAGVKRMSIEERIDAALASPVVLFMKGTPDFPQCGFSAQSVQVLRASGVEFAHVNILEDPDLRQALKQRSNWPTYPQLYVNGELIGGSDILLEMYRSGELAEKLGTAAAQ